MKMVLQFWPLGFHSLVNTAGVFITKSVFVVSAPTPKGGLCSASVGDSWLRCCRRLRLAIPVLAQPAGERSVPVAPGAGRRGPQGLRHRVLAGGTSGHVTCWKCRGPVLGRRRAILLTAQFIVCRTVISPPSSREVPVQAAGWMGLPGTDHSRVGFHTEGRFEIALSALQGPRPVCACPYLRVASAPRASSWEGR